MPVRSNSDMNYSHDDPFAVFMQPPPGETPEQAEARLNAQAEAQRISDEIDEQIKQDRLLEKKQRPFRMLVRVHIACDWSQMRLMLKL